MTLKANWNLEKKRIRRENKNLWTLNKENAKYWGKDQVYTVIGGESSYWMELLVLHRESTILCSHPTSRHLVSLSPFWRTVKKEILCMNLESSKIIF